MFCLKWFWKEVGMDKGIGVYIIHQASSFDLECICKKQVTNEVENISCMKIWLIHIYSCKCDRCDCRAIKTVTEFFIHHISFVTLCLSADCVTSISASVYIANIYCIKFLKSIGPSFKKISNSNDNNNNCNIVSRNEYRGLAKAWS